MRELLLVGAGGFIGSVSRYYVGGWVLHATAASRVPLATFTVNFIGCLVVGVLLGLVETGVAISPNARLLIFTGILGGFTTFSAFGAETAMLSWRLAWMNIALHLLLALPAVWAGRAFAIALRR